MKISFGRKETAGSLGGLTRQSTMSLFGMKGMTMKSPNEGGSTGFLNRRISGSKIQPVKGETMTTVEPTQAFDERDERDT